MLKKFLIAMILLVSIISCDNEPEEKTYTVILNKEEYKKRVAEIENEINNKNYEKAKEMLLEIAKYNRPVRQPIIQNYKLHKLTRISWQIFFFYFCNVWIIS